MLLSKTAIFNERLSSDEFEGVVAVAKKLKKAQSTLNKVLQHQEDFKNIFDEMLKAANNMGEDVLKKVNDVIEGIGDQNIEFDQRLKGQLAHIKNLQDKYATLSEWLERFKNNFVHVIPSDSSNAGKQAIYTFQDLCRDFPVK